MTDRQQRGAMMIEVLVSMLICAFGVLGLAALQARASQAEFESYQRSQALLLVDDMVNRINANRDDADAYLSNGLLGAGAQADCSTATTMAARDVCEWGNLLRGSGETRNGAAVGAMLTARGCIAKATGTTDRYVVSVFWAGTVPSGAPASTCAGVNDVYPTASLRRAVSSTLCMAAMSGSAASNRC